MNGNLVLSIVAGLIAGLFVLGGLAALGFGIRDWRRPYAGAIATADEQKVTTRGRILSIAGGVLLFVSGRSCSLLSQSG